MFQNINDIVNGKTALVRNYTSQALAISQITNSGDDPFSWYIDPWNISLPYNLPSGDSLNLTVKLAIPATSAATNLLCDTLFINTANTNNHIMVCVDPYLLTGINTFNKPADVTVFPNPMNSSATFRLSNTMEADVRIEMYSTTGELVSVVCDQRLAQGIHSIAWEGNGLNGSKLTPGIYLYRVKQGNKLTSGKIAILP